MYIGAMLVAQTQPWWVGRSRNGLRGCTEKVCAQGRARGSGVAAPRPPDCRPGGTTWVNTNGEPGETGASDRAWASRAETSDQLDAKKTIRVVWSTFNPDTLGVRAKVRNKSRQTVWVAVLGNCVGVPTN
jgi:hypothetical protein